MTGRLAGKVALITGAARGQGEAEARLFVAEGAKVAVTDVLDGHGEAVAQSLGDAAFYHHLDVTIGDDSPGGRLRRRPGAAWMWRSTTSRIAVPPAPIERQSVQDHRRIIDTNLNGVFLGMRAVVPMMTRQRTGSIINVSSIDGLVSGRRDDDVRGEQSSR